MPPQNPFAQSRLVSILLALVVAVPSALAQVPDLTNGGVRSNNIYWNLGPTGMRGWVYHQGSSTALARQIEVTTVKAGSPADGLLAVGDVILGANGTGAVPVAFASDARIAFGHALADAEARNPATLKLLRWRAGSIDTVTLTLEYLGAYSATAPFNCPKSAAILEKGLDAIMAGSGKDNYNFALITLLAANDPSNPKNAARMNKAREWAHELILTPDEMARYTSGVPLSEPKAAWTIGMKLMAIAEYYLATRDEAVFESMRAYAIAYATGQSMFGTSGHNFALPRPDGSVNGPYGIGYGVINSANMQCFYGALLAREAGATDQVILDAIERAKRFYGSYAHLGSIPYGEHLPGMGHESNGKSGAAAACFALEGTRPDVTNFYTKMATAAQDTRDTGHTGPWFNYLWSPLGVFVGGEAALASYFAQQSWHYDLSRNADGTFTFDTLGQGAEDNGKPNWSSANLQMYMANLMTYAAPLRQTYITGKNRAPDNDLTDSQLAEAKAAPFYDATTRTTSELIEDLDIWSPSRRGRAGKELAVRTGEHASILPVLHGMVGDTGISEYARMGACDALLYINNDASVPFLAAALTDASRRVRWSAAFALANADFSEAALYAHVDTMLAACVSEARPLLPLDEADPLHLVHGQIAVAIFSRALWSHDLVGIDRNLLYPAIRAAARNPRGGVRSSLAKVLSKLSERDLEAVADAVVMATHTESPADRMFAEGIRRAGVNALFTHRKSEGVALAKKVYPDLSEKPEDVLDVLRRYGAASLTVEPNPDIKSFCEILIATNDHVDLAQQILNAIATDTDPISIRPLKQINRIEVSSHVVNLPSNRINLKVHAYDHVGSELIYTWRKVHGAGKVTFVPNGTSSAASVAILDGVPGNYGFEVTVTDALGLTQVSAPVSVTLNGVDGTLPANGAPTADPQSIDAYQGALTQLTLTGSDPEGRALSYSIVSGPQHGQLAGTAPSLIYVANMDYTGSDHIDFQVMDSEGQVAEARVSIQVLSPGTVGLAIYEPFAYSTGALNGKLGTTEVGLSGSWTAGTSLKLESPSLSHGAVKTTGNRAYINDTAAPSAFRPISAAALKDRGLLDDGATLWFSVLAGNASSSSNQRLELALANNGFGRQHYILDEGSTPGSGLGVTLQDDEVYATAFRDASQGTTSTAPLLGAFDPNASGKFLNLQQRLIVGKITWGKDLDTVEIYFPSNGSMVLPEKPSSSLEVDVDQSMYDVLTFSCGAGFTAKMMVDEIRFGATYQSVSLGTVAMSEDVTAPDPNPMTFAVPPTLTGRGAVTMVATTALDPKGVEYYFACVAGGGSDSGWQDSPEYTDRGLLPGGLYGYTVRARDKPYRNLTEPSVPFYARTPQLGDLPDVVGLPQSSAVSLIQEAGMALGDVVMSTSFSQSIPAGHVISQNPSGPVAAEYGTAVDLVVSIGQDPVLPTLTAVDIADDTVALSAKIGDPVTYTLTFSREMNLASINPGDFTNLGSVPIVIEEIAQTAPGVVTVVVRATGAQSGTLLLAVARGADLRDTLGNALNTTEAIVDEYAIQVDVKDPATVTPNDWLIPVAATASSAKLGDEPHLVIDGSGLSSENLYGRHAAGRSLNWSMSSTDGTWIRDEWITVDLGALYDLTSLHLWQFTRDNVANDVRRGVKVFDVLVSADGVNYSEVITDAVLNQALDANANFLPDGGEAPQSFDLVQTGVRYVRIAIDQTFESTGDKDYQGGLGEIRLQGLPAGTMTSAKPVWDRNPLEMPAIHHGGSISGSLDDHVSDEDTPTLVFSKVSGPAWLHVAADGSLSGTPSIADLGLNVFKVSASDQLYAPIEVELVVRVLPINQPPVFDQDVIARGDAAKNSPYIGSIASVASDPEGGGVTFSKLSGPEWLRVATDGALSGVPRDADLGANVFTVGASDPLGAAVSATLQITVIDGNDAPTFNVYPIQGDDATEDAAYSATLNGTASDDGIGGPLRYAKSSGPDWLSVAPDGALSGTPTNDDVGTNAFVVTVSDGMSPPVGARLYITVLNVNDVPVFALDSLVRADAMAGLDYTGTLNGAASDPDGDSISYSKLSGPAWLAVAQDGTLSGVAPSANVGDNLFMVAVTDVHGASTSVTLQIRVVSAGSWIVPVAAYATSSESGTTPEMAIDGSGLSAETAQGLHAAGTGLSWSMQAGNGILVRDESITFDLGAAYDLKLLHIWQFTRNSTNDGSHGVKVFDVDVSADNVNFTPALVDGVLNKVVNLSSDNKPLGNEPCQNFSLIQNHVRYVRIGIDQTYLSGGGNDYRGGFGEVRFEGTLANPANQPPSNVVLDVISIAENNRSGETVGHFTAVDEDVDQVHAFSLVDGEGSNDNASFTIDGTALKMVARADYEVKPSYQIRVQADDGEGGTYAKSFTITVIDLDENPATFSGWLAASLGVHSGGPTADDDGGGLCAALEWVFGGNPSDPADDLLQNPECQAKTPSSFTISFRRSAAAGADPNTSIRVQYGSDLSDRGNWVTAVPNGTTIVANVIENGAGPGVDLIEYTLDRSLASGSKLFVHVKVEVNP